MAITVTVAQGQQYSDYPGGNTGDVPLEMSFDVKFQSSCEYDHGDNDQYDWNKLGGFVAINSSPNYASARWGWRWDLANSKVEIAPYVHDNNYSAILPPSSQWIQVDLNDWFTVKVAIERSNNRFKFTFDNGGTPTVFYVSAPNSMSNYGSSCSVSLFWFGGTKNAPHEMKIDYDNFAYTTPPRQYYITGESSGGVTVTGEYPDGSPYSQYLSMNQTELTPCLKKNSLSTTDVTITEDSFCG